MNHGRVVNPRRWVAQVPAPTRAQALGYELPTLPSVTAAHEFHLGVPGGFRSVLLSTLGRAVLIAVGLGVAGERRRLVPYSLAAAASIELFVLAVTRPKPCK
jgi:hypothetical protein